MKLKNIIFTLLSIFTLSVSAFSCESDPVNFTRGHCGYGLLNIYFQQPCQDAFFTAAYARNVAEGAKLALEEFNEQVSNLPRVDPSKKSSYGQIRGMAIAGSQTADLHLSALQLIISRFEGVKSQFKESEEQAKYRYQADKAAYDSLKESGGSEETIAEIRQKLDTYVKIKDDFKEGLQELNKAEKKARKVRADLIAMKNKVNSKMAQLLPEDREIAQKEDELTAKLSKDEQSFWDGLYSSCFQNNGLRSGCSRALDAAEFFSFFTGFFGGLRSALYAGGKQLGKELFKTYYSDENLRTLIQCGQGKCFTVMKIDRKEDSN